jgi:hypothetical protein
MFYSIFLAFKLFGGWKTCGGVGFNTAAGNNRAIKDVGKS